MQVTTETRSAALNQAGPGALSPGIHAAIIMDGNGRWAAARGLRRMAGHRAGVEAVRRIVEAAPDLGISTLTLYAFSADNWRRPLPEVTALMALLGRYLRQEIEELARKGVRLQAIGRRDRFSGSLVRQLEAAERSTSAGRRLLLRLALDYSSRHAIFEAAKDASAPEELARKLGPDVDLLVRTSGEQRLSDFLLWECAYAEMVFTERMWPDFSASDLAEAIAEFHRRDRRFGAVSPERSLRTA